MSKKHKILNTPACTIAMAGGKKNVNSKHVLLVVAFAKKQGLSFESAADVVSRAVDCLLDRGNTPASVADFATRIGSTMEVACSLLDALQAFGYIKVS